MTTTHTSGAADLPEAPKGTAADGKTELFNFPGHPLMVRAADFNRLHGQLAALAAGQAVAAPAQPVAQQGVACTAPERMVSTQEICDKFAFLEGAVTETCYWRIVNVADSIQTEALRAARAAGRLERERICAAIKVEDDYCVDHGNYMLDSDDCIKIVRGEWVRPDFAIDAARAAQKE